MTVTARHTAATVAEARRLSEAGWSNPAIQGIMARRGIPIAIDTILRWVNPEYDERERRRQRAAHRIKDARKSRGRLGAGPARSPEFRLERIRNLAALKVPHDAIAAVMTFDFPNEPITEGQVTYALRSGRPPRAYRIAFDSDPGNARRKQRLARDPVAA